MHELLRNGSRFEIIFNGAAVAMWADWQSVSCSRDFAQTLVDCFPGRSLPFGWIVDYLDDRKGYGVGNWLIPTSDGKLLHMDGSVSLDLDYGPVSLTEAVLDMISLIRNPILSESD